MRFNTELDKLVSQILSEEIKLRHEEKFGKKGQWMEIDMDEELHGSQSKIDVASPKGKITAADFKKLRGSKINKKMKESEMEEDDEMEEGNAFTGALSKAKKSGKDSFEVDGKSYNVKENNNISLSEDELIDMIENIVKEQMVKDSSEKNNFGVTKPQGLKKTEKAQSESKKENDDYASEVVKKMKDYMKDMFMGGGSYDENPDDYPQSNYQMDKDAKVMKYNPSDAF